MNEQILVRLANQRTVALDELIYVRLFRTNMCSQNCLFLKEYMFAFANLYLFDFLVQWKTEIKAVANAD